MSRVKTYAELSGCFPIWYDNIIYETTMSRYDYIRWKEDGYTVGDISNLTGRSRDTIRKMYRHYDVSPNLDIQKSPWDLKKILDEEDVDGQYSIGFLAADGYLSTSRKVIACWVQERDVEILRRICWTLGNPDRNLTERKLPSHKNSQVGVNIGSVDLVRFLSQQYGFSNTKSRTLPFPRHLRNPIFFLRGFMDGDGYIGNGCAFTCSSKDFIDGLLDWVWDKYGYRPNVQLVGMNKDCYNVWFRKKHSDFIHDLFEIPGLSRKTQAYRDYLLAE